MNSFTTVIYTFKVPKHILIGQSTNINVFSWLLFFFKLRERESGIQNLGIKEKCPQSYLSYFSTGFHWRIFLLSRANRLCSIFFYTGLKNLGSLRVSVILLSSTRSKMAMVRLPATDPCSKLIFLILYFRWGEGSPSSVLGSQPIIWLLSLSLLVSGDLRLLSTKHLVSPVWPIFLPNGHLFDG